MKFMKKIYSRRYFWVAIFVVIAAACASLWCFSVPFARYDGSDARINFPSGSSAEAITDSLRAHLGAYGEKVATLWHLADGSPETAHGSYVVKHGTRALDASRMIKNGRQTPVRVVFNNARTMDDLAAKISRYLEFSDADFIAACDSTLPGMGYDKDNFEAAFVPDTYEFYWTAEPEYVVSRLVGFRDRFWNDSRTAKAAALGLTAQQVATLASIAEEETAKADELPKVARLYLNRLDRGMPLQADPTVKYAVGDFSLRRILAKHLAVGSPYNTYKNTGLPPGPIRVASQQAIDAVLDAPVHDYIFMCAKEDFSGYHNFATNLAAHQANARKYQAELNRRGIK